MATLKVWNYERFSGLISREGVKIDRKELVEVADIAGITVFQNPELPEGRCEFRDVNGNLIFAFDLK